MTLSDPNLSGVCYWQASGKTVSLVPAGALTGAAGSTTMTITGLPAFLSPTTTQNTIAGVENNTTAGYGMAQILSTGAITVYPAPQAIAWTNAGTKGLINTVMTYTYA
jgi:hypothetical protein